jgi:hypothetical protein
MYHQKFPPDASLKPYIRSYHLIGLDSGDFLFPADGCPGLIVNLGDPFLLGFEEGRSPEFT